jgi:hypothetical protein
MWKLMTEAYLGINIPYAYNKWEDVYKFVTLIGKDTYLLFSRDVFHAKVGLLLNVPLINVPYESLLLIVEQAQSETLSFVLDLPQLKDEWKKTKYITSAMKYLREDIAMLLVQDGRCLQNRANIEAITTVALLKGCGEVFMYLADNFPNDIPEEIGDMYTISCCYGLEDVAEAIQEIDPYLNYDSGVKSGQAMLKYLKTGIEKDLPRYIQYDCVYAMIRSGNALLAHRFVKYYSNESDNILYESLCISLRNRTLTDLSDLEPYINSEPRTPGLLLLRIIRDPNYDLDVIRQLSTLVPRDTLIDLGKHSLTYGNWKYAEAMSSTL